MRLPTSLLRMGFLGAVPDLLCPLTLLFGCEELKVACSTASLGWEDSSALYILL